ncbi:MAG: ABC transporter permease [Acidimicrobiales bacterium]
MKILTIAATNLRRFSRDRTNIFFVLVLPLAIVLLIGLQYGENANSRMGIVAGDDPVSRDIVDRLDSHDRVDLFHHDDADALADAVADGDRVAGVVVPTDIAERLAAGESVEIGFLAAPTGVGPQMRAIVDDTVARAVAGPTAVAAAVERGADPDEAAAVVAANADGFEQTTVSVTTTGERLFPEDIGGFDVGAPSQLVLFMFLTGLTGSAVLIQSRSLGVSRRMMSTPTGLGTIIAGETLGRFVIVVGQGLYIMGAAAILFDVSWGNLVAAAAILTVFAAVAAAAALLAGAVFDNDEQAGGITVVLGLGVAALGGSMLPIELFSDTMVTIARFTPHYWAIDAFSELVRHDGGLADITTSLSVLAVFAVVIGAIATWRLRVSLVRP